MQLIQFSPLEGTAGKVTGYIHDQLVEIAEHREKYPVMVVCPGGGYNMCSQRESDPVAFEYLTAGYNVFILRYSVKEASKDFTPLKELSSTVMKIRENAEQWNCDPDKIAVVGFSAGGHLAASICTLWNNPKFLEHFDNKNGMNKPNAGVLAYAVISADPEIYHGGSIDNVSGGKTGEEREIFSLEKQVTADCPQMFLWHTVNDNCVPVENSIVFISSLQKNQIPFEAHFFPEGPHGSSVCTSEVNSLNDHNNQWVDLSKKWLAKTFDYKL